MAAYVIHEDPAALTPSTGGGLDDRVNALLEKMVADLEGASAALERDNATGAREAYLRFHASYDDLGSLLGQIGFAEPGYEAIASRINATNDEVRAVLEASDAYGRSLRLYGASGGEGANATTAAADVVASYEGLSSSYDSLRRSVTALREILAGRGLDPGRLDAAIDSLDRHENDINQSYRNLGLPERPMPLPANGTAASLSLDADANAASFGDTVNVTGRLIGDGDGMPGRAVDILLGDAPLATVTTGLNGTFGHALRIGASAPAGSSQIRAVYYEGTNGSLASATSDVTIIPMATGLTLDITGTASPYRASGTLHSASGVPVPGAEILLWVDGSPAASGTTGDDGRYDIAFDVADGTAATGHSAYASFDPGTGKALLPSTSSTAEVTAMDDQGGLATFVLPGAALLLVLASAGAIAYRRSRARPKGIAPPGAPPAAAAPPAPPLNVGEELERIRATGEGNPRDALARAYVAARGALSARIPLEDSMTHHEVYRASVAALPAVSAPLGELLLAYEMAAFSNRPVSRADLEQALGLVRRVDEIAGEAGP